MYNEIDYLAEFEAFRRKLIKIKQEEEP